MSWMCQVVELRTWELAEKHLVICLVIKTPTPIITHIVDQNTTEFVRKKPDLLVLLLDFCL